MRRAALALVMLMALGAATVGGFQHWRGQRESELAVQWDALTGLFDWGPASVRLPPGFTHHRLRGIDTIMGELISRDGRIVIVYDIGELAGEHGGIGAFQESARGGSRVRFARSGQGASFPDNGCARFYLDCDSREGRAAIHAITGNFQPRNRLPAFLMPLLPEPVRRHCRYRLPDFNLF